MKYFFLIFTFLFSYTIYAQIIGNVKVNDVRTFEVDALQIDENTLICVWMEAMPERKVWEQAGNMQVSYSISKNLGITWREKKVLKVPEGVFLTGNPYLTKDEKGNVFLAAMRLNADFFSGDIAIYGFNAEREEFILEGVPSTTTNSLLDKPALSVCGNILNLFYVETGNTLETAIIQYQYSNDNGKTWTEKEAIPQNENILYLGIDAKCLDYRLQLSYGSYWYQHIYFSEAIINDGKVYFKEAKEIADVSKKLVSGLTELKISDNGNMAIGWFFPHQPNEVYIATSKNDGETWSHPLLLSEEGNMLAFDFDKDGVLHCLYSEYIGNEGSVIYKKLDLNSLIVEKIYLSKSKEIKGERDYIGAFQKLIVTKNDEILAFWIDYADNNKLYVSKMAK